MFVLEDQGALVAAGLDIVCRGLHREGAVAGGPFVRPGVGVPEPEPEDQGFQLGDLAEFQAVAIQVQATGLQALGGHRQGKVGVLVQIKAVDGDVFRLYQEPFGGVVPDV